ncbi:MAG: hypothetical protein J0L92_28715 [Deltaproteobacteria bacterium]|nr:hypothetical protein [Deltaproteobacteria bacterium]
MTDATIGSLAGENLIELDFSEEVMGDIDTTEWRVEDASGELDCAGEGSGRDRVEHRAVLSCARRPVGTVRIDFGGTMRTVLGTELVDRNDRAVTGAVFEVPDAPEGSDDLLVAAVYDRSP